MATKKSNAPTSDKLNAAEWHRHLITADRYRGKSSIPNRTIAEEAASDRARVIYCSAFRRLQRKTQVFTLSKDAAVRSRLTHSLEVASVGRLIAQKVVDTALLEAKLDYASCSALVSLVETACLAHDIGNPSFGHFGESAIQEWFRDSWPTVANSSRWKNPKLKELSKDFENFDGNPQGIRILTRLQGRTQKERRAFGMDLTYSQILTALKYPRGPLDTPLRNPEWKKAGFFESDRSKVKLAWDHFGFDPNAQRRFPLAYLVEAADDISYCIGDMEDGIDRSILTPHQFFEQLDDWIQGPRFPSPLNNLRSKAQGFRKELKDLDVKDPNTAGAAKDLFFEFKTQFTAAMIEEAAIRYGDGLAEEIRLGRCQALLADSDAHDLLQTLKRIARRFLYPADKVQRPFLAGLRVTQGILHEYGRILSLTKDDFKELRSAWRSSDRELVSSKKLETLLPLLDCLPPHYLDVYDFALTQDAEKKKWTEEAWELFCRAHLIVDYLSGMTDDFAFQQFQIISGAMLE